MRGHFAGWIGQRLQRGLARRHPRIVKDEAIGPAIAAPLAIVGRGNGASDERAIGAKTRRHVPRPEPCAAREKTAPWRVLAMARDGLDRSVPGAADAVAVAVPTPSRAAVVIARRRDGVADQRARARADNAAGNSAAGAAAGERRSDERAASGAERAADQRALLLLRRAAARYGQCAH